MKNLSLFFVFIFVLGLSYQVKALESTSPSSTSSSFLSEVLKPGIKNNENVKLLQQFLVERGYLKDKIDGWYGAKTYEAVKRFQTENNLKSDGHVGNVTWSAINANGIKIPSNIGTNTNTHNTTNGTTETRTSQSNTLIELLKPGVKNENVRLLQEILTEKGYLKDKIDGWYGAKTYEAVKRFQTENNLKSDGHVGNVTWSAINPSVFSTTTISNKRLDIPNNSNTNNTNDTVAVTPPLINLSIDPINISQNQSATISWSTTNATVCGASNGWTGTKSTNGTETINNINSNTTFVLSCKGPSGSTSKSVYLSVTPTPIISLLPKITFYANPTGIEQGKNSTLTWSSTNADYCTASGGWSGRKEISGTQIITNINTPTRYILTCTGASGSSKLETEVNIYIVDTIPTTQQEIPPTISLSASPLTVTSGGSTTLTWNVNNATTCLASNGWKGNKSATGGSQIITNITAPKTFGLNCTGTGGATSNSIIVLVNQQAAEVDTTPTPTTPVTPAPTTPTPITTQNAPTINFSAYPTSIAYNGSAYLTWSSSNASSCTASGGWTGNKNTTGGSQIISNLTSDKIFTFSCTGNNKTTTKSIYIEVAPQVATPPPPPTPPITQTPTPVTPTTPPLTPNTPTVSLSSSATSIVSGGSLYLTWYSTNATSCMASGGWNGHKIPSGGSQLVSSITTNTTFTLACGGNDQTIYKSVNVSVSQPVNSTPDTTTNPPYTPVPNQNTASSYPFCAKDKTNKLTMAFILVSPDPTNQRTAEFNTFLNNTKVPFEQGFKEATYNLATINVADIVTLKLKPEYTLGSGVLSHPAIIKDLIASKGDKYDLVSVFTVGNLNGSTYWQYNAHAQQKTRNINNTPYYDSSPQYGSNGRLLAYTFHGDLLANKQDQESRPEYIYTNRPGSPKMEVMNLIHEIGHTWCCSTGDQFTRSNDMSRLEITGPVGASWGHYYPGLAAPSNTQDPLGAGTYKLNSSTNTYSYDYDREIYPIRFHPLTLYFMGLLPKDRYSEKHNIIDIGTNPGGASSDINLQVYRTISVNDIIARYGERTCME